jgi:hypothetical protein
MMQTSSDGRGAQLSWRWRKGAATTAAALGDPGTTSYALCVFDESPTLAQSTLVMFASAPAGEACSPRPHRRPCWKKSARGVLSYRDPDRTPIAAIRLKPGADGHAEATVTGAGPRLRLPSLPTDLPLRVQLQSSAGQCWEATHSDAVRNDAVRFRSRGH